MVVTNNLSNESWWNLILCNWFSFLSFVPGYMQSMLSMSQQFYSPCNPKSPVDAWDDLRECLLDMLQLCYGSLHRALRWAWSNRFINFFTLTLTHSPQSVSSTLVSHLLSFPKSKMERGVETKREDRPKIRRKLLKRVWSLEFGSEPRKSTKPRSRGSTLDGQ